MFQNNAGEDFNFSWDECKTKNRLLLVLWNTHKLLINLSKDNKVNPFKLKNVKLDTEEKYIFSKLNSSIEKATKLFDEYRLNEVPWVIEELYLELSRTYIQLIREKYSTGSNEDKKIVLYTIYNVFIEILKLLAPIAPFITEEIYQNLKKEFKLKIEIQENGERALPNKPSIKIE